MLYLHLLQEGRGIGLTAKIHAYALQDGGLDTYEANAALGLPEDPRDFAVAVRMLHALGVGRLTLLANNPTSCAPCAKRGSTSRRGRI